MPKGVAPRRALPSAPPRGTLSVQGVSLSRRAVDAGDAADAPAEPGTPARATPSSAAPVTDAATATAATAAIVAAAAAAAATAAASSLAALTLSAVPASPAAFAALSPPAAPTVPASPPAAFDRDDVDGWPAYCGDTYVDACVEGDPPEYPGMAARLDVLDEDQRGILFQRMPHDWKDFLVLAPRDRRAEPELAYRGSYGHFAGWVHRRRHEIAMALASEAAVATAAARGRTRRCSGRTRAQMPGGGDYLPGICRGLATTATARPLPPGVPPPPVPTLAGLFSVQLILCGGSPNTSFYNVGGAASTFTAGDGESEPESDAGEHPSARAWAEGFWSASEEEVDGWSEGEG
jgi:hypothetical protein